MPKLSTASHGLFATLFPVFVLCVLALALGFLVLHFFAPKLERRLLQLAGSPAAIIGVICVFGLLYGLLAYLVLTFPGFIDPGEPMIASVSFFAVHGVPVYKMFIPYGPLCYFPYGLALRLFGAGIPTLKATVFAGNVLLLGLLYAIFRRYLRPRAALLTLGLVIAAFMMKQVYMLQIRGDLFIYIAVALGMLGATARRAWVAVLLLTLALTLGIGIKVTAVLYLLYPCAIVWKRFGLRSLVYAAAAAAALNLAPFSLPNLNLHDYVYWLREMSHELRSTKELVGNLLTTVILLFPCGLLYWQLHSFDQTRAQQYLRERQWLFAALLVGLLGIDVLGGKFGAGRHHLIPFFILSASVCAEIYSLMPAASATRPVRSVFAFGWAAIGLLLFISETGELRDQWRLTQAEAAQARSLRQDVATIEAQYAGEKIEVGDGRGLVDLDTLYSPQYAAPLLVFAGHPYTFDQSSQADLELMQLPVSAANMDYLRSCQTPVWLIPRGDVPFQTKSIYSDMYPRSYPDHLVFDDEFRRVFQTTYVRTGASRYFDVYTCRARGQGPI
jgi:hypothetical protein